MLIRKLKVSYPTYAKAAEAFQKIIAEVWMPGKVEAGQGMSGFFAAVQQVIKDEACTQEPRREFASATLSSLRLLFPNRSSLH